MDHSLSNRLNSEQDKIITAVYSRDLVAIRYWFNVTENNHVPHKFNEIIVLGLLARHSNRCVLKEL